MKYELNVQDRLILLSILPEKGNFSTIKIVSDLVDRVGIDAKEAESIGLRQDGASIRWDAEEASSKEIDLNSVEEDIIKRALESLDAAGELTKLHIPLWNKFMKE